MADDRRRSTLRVQATETYLNPRISSLRQSCLHGRGSNVIQLRGRSRGPGDTLIAVHPLFTKGKIRKFLYDVVENKRFHSSMLLIILTNTALIGLQTVPSVHNKIGWYLSQLDVFYLAVYFIEFVLKFGALHLKYFYDKWNVFDFFIVVTSLIDFVWPMIMEDQLSLDTDLFKIFRLLKSFRALRALRVIRTIKFLKNLQITVNAIIQSIPALGSIIMLIGLVLYIFAIIGKGLYKDVDPIRFGNIGKFIIVRLYRKL